MVDKDSNGRKAQRWPVKRLFNLDKIKGKVSLSDSKLQDLYEKIEDLIRVQVQDIYGNVSDFRYLYITNLLMERIRGALKEKNEDQSETILEGTLKQVSEYSKEIVSGLSDDFEDILKENLNSNGVILSDVGLHAAVEAISEAVSSYLEDIYNDLPELQKRISELEDVVLLISEQVSEIYKDTHDGKESSLSDLKKEVISDVTQIKAELKSVRETSKSQLKDMQASQAEMNAKLKTSLQKSTSDIVSKRVDRLNKIQTQMQNGIKRNFKNIQTASKGGIKKLSSQHKDIESVVISRLHKVSECIDKVRSGVNTFFDGIFSFISWSLNKVFNFVKWTINTLVVKPLKIIWGITKQIWSVVGKSFWTGFFVFLMTPAGMRMLGSITGFIWFRFLKPIWDYVVEIGNRLQKVFQPFEEWLDNDNMSFGDAIMRSLRLFRDEVIFPIVDDIKGWIWGPENRNVPLMTLIWQSVKKAVDTIWNIQLPIDQNSTIAKAINLQANAMSRFVSMAGISVPVSNFGGGVKIGDIIATLIGVRLNQFLINCGLLIAKFGVQAALLFNQFRMWKKRNRDVDEHFRKIRYKLKVLMQMSGISNNITPGRRRPAGPRYQRVGNHWVDTHRRGGKNGNFFISVKDEVAEKYNKRLNERLRQRKMYKLKSYGSNALGYLEGAMILRSLLPSSEKESDGYSFGDFVDQALTTASYIDMARRIPGVGNLMSKLGSRFMSSRLGTGLASAGKAAAGWGMKGAKWLGGGSAKLGLAKAGGYAALAYGLYEGFSNYDYDKSIADNYMNNDESRTGFGDATIWGVGLAGAAETGGMSLIAATIGSAANHVIGPMFNHFIEKNNETLNKILVNTDKLLYNQKQAAWRTRLNIHENGMTADEYVTSLNLMAKKDATLTEEYLKLRRDLYEAGLDKDKLAEIREKLGQERFTELAANLDGITDDNANTVAMYEQFKKNKVLDEASVRKDYAEQSTPQAIAMAYSELAKDQLAEIGGKYFSKDKLIAASKSENWEEEISKLLTFESKKAFNENRAQLQQAVEKLSQHQTEQSQQTKDAIEKLMSVVYKRFDKVEAKQDYYGNKPPVEEQEEENISLVEAFRKGENIM